MTRHTRLQKRIRHSPVRQAKRAKNRHEATRPQEYKRYRMSADQILYLFSPTKRAEMRAKMDGISSEKSPDA